ncbi:MAG: RluA family pseudouridine synthase [Acidobacteria bacterium]|nr:RluA family pseudouridine synthase [Acidobacteriota bacterium]
MTKLTFQVPADEHKVRLEDFLFNAVKELSRMYIRGLIKSGKVEVNGQNENSGYRLRSNDFVEIEADMERGTAHRPEAMDLCIVFEDDQIIVVDKPIGMLVHPSHYEQNGTLLNGLTFHLNRHGGRFVRPGLPHRLDKQTSGLIVAAKTARAHRILSNDFMKKRVEKRYLALVEGAVDAAEGTIEAPIGRYDELKHWNVKDDGKHSVSRYWIRQRLEDTTLIELEPVTGRTNQLRIHCESIGHPIVGDAKRGGREYDRLCLHAWKLTIPHPISRESMSFESPISFTRS